MRVSRQNYFARAAVLCLLAGCGSTLLHSGWAAPEPVGTVTGNVLVRRKGIRTTTQLRANDRVYAGDVVVSPRGALTSLRFKDGSRVEMNSGASIEITANGSTSKGKPLFRALQGRMAVRLQPGRIVATRTALMRVKGTEFLLDVADDGTTTLTVVEGTVEFYNPCGDILVHESQQSTIYPGSPPSAPSAVPNLGPLLEWRKALENPTTNNGELQPTFDAAAKVENISLSGQAGLLGPIQLQSQAQMVPSSSKATSPSRKCDCGG